ncbi:MAG: dihydropyrimidinase [bacterium]|nr:dihydropyrimidinase [bacterium]
MRTLVKDGRIVTAVDDYHADVLIVDGVITEIARVISDPEAEVIDAKDRMVIPGGVDPHTHLDSFSGRTTTSDDFLTGSRAAAVGGTTTLIDFAKQNKGEALRQACDTWQGKARDRTCIDYAFHLIVVEVDEQRLAEIPAIIEDGVTSVKMYMAYRDRLMVDDGTIFRTMLAFKEHGGLVALHAENGDVIDVLIQQAVAAGQLAPKYHAATRPPVAEAEAVFRAICIAEIAECPVYFVHLSSRQALEQLQRARDRGLPVFAETCPHYLLLDESLYDQPGFEGGKYVLTPPLRSIEHQEALWTGIRAGDISVISTDHCPYCFADQKALGKDDFSKIPNGGPGIENRLSLIYNAGVHGGRINDHQFVDLVATQPAKIFGLFPRKGTIAVGSDGDLVIFDPQGELEISAATHMMNIDYNMYEGMQVRGTAETVLLRGKPIVRERKFVGQPGDGQYVPRQRYRYR